MLPENIKNPVTGETVPVQNRPNFLPEGMSKWLLDLTDGAIDKKWLREEITWEVSDEKGKGLDESAYEIMLKHAISGKTIYEDLSLGFIEASYDNMNQIWQAQLDIEPDTTLLDIQNAFKYSETMGVLRSDPEISGRQGGNGPGGRGEAKDEPKSLRDIAKEDYQGKYDKDRIAILICQDKKAGELDEKLERATMNGLRLSLRSMEGSIHAELIASLFGGGGHGGAAGGRVDLPGVEINTPLAVKVNGKIEHDYKKVLDALKHNYELTHNRNTRGNRIPLEIVKDQNGIPCREMIKELVTQIRAEQPVEQRDSGRADRNQNNNRSKKGGKKGGKRRPHFTGLEKPTFNKTI